MPFYQQLLQHTEADRAGLLSAPIIGRALRGDITVADYAAFLGQAYHHVKHTVPLLMAVGGRLPERLEWLRTAVAEYIEEEIGHHEWVLNDIAACGFDREAARASRPLPATELMVAYAYDTVQRGNPVGFFGMVLVLEGTSIRLADQVADAVQRATGLSDNAFTYLRSHGALDQDHVRFYADLMDRLEQADDRAAVSHAAGMFYRLYGDIFRSLGPA